MEGPHVGSVGEEQRGTLLITAVSTAPIWS
jgi:hypothetical protein